MHILYGNVKFLTKWIPKSLRSKKKILKHTIRLCLSCFSDFNARIGEEFSTCQCKTHCRVNYTNTKDDYYHSCERCGKPFTLGSKIEPCLHLYNNIQSWLPMKDIQYFEDGSSQELSQPTQQTSCSTCDFLLQTRGFIQNSSYENFMLAKCREGLHDQCQNCLLMGFSCHKCLTETEDISPTLTWQAQNERSQNFQTNCITKKKIHAHSDLSDPTFFQSVQPFLNLDAGNKQIQNEHFFGVMLFYDYFFHKKSME
jgi:hypothetical protein